MNGKILIIEDDSASIKLMEYIFHLARYETVTASNGKEGLKRARKEKPDMVILDVMLPGIDGFEICSRLRTNTATASLPILMITAKAHVSDMAAGIDAGADDYMVKPASPEEIIRRTRNLLSRKRQPNERLQPGYRTANRNT